MASFSRRLAAEAIGTFGLLAAIVGSGVMAERLAVDPAVALLANAIATGAALIVLIQMFGPISGAHFNPAVTLMFALRREIGAVEGALYLGAQLVGGAAGVAAAHLMFDLPAMASGIAARAGPGQWLAETIATGGLVLVILGVRRASATSVPWAVGLYITSAIWFTASTSFANPAVTLARALTDTYTSILPAHAPAFIAAQAVGATLATFLWAWFEKDFERCADG